jgi:hypothetical protein
MNNKRDTLTCFSLRIEDEQRGSALAFCYFFGWYVFNPIDPVAITNAGACRACFLLPPLVFYMFLFIKCIIYFLYVQAIKNVLHADRILYLD